MNTETNNTPTTWEEAADQLWESAQKRHLGRLKILPKYAAKPFWSFLATLLKIVTFGRGIDLLEDYYTTILTTIYTPGDGRDWENMSGYRKYGLLSHEIDHFDLAWFNDHSAQDRPTWPYSSHGLFFYILYSIKYFIWPFPYKFAFYRQQVEKWGYERNADVHIVRHQGTIQPEFKEWMRVQFCSAAYGWMATNERFEQIYAEVTEGAKIRYNSGQLDHLKGLR